MKEILKACYAITAIISLFISLLVGIIFAVAIAIGAGSNLLGVIDILVKLSIYMASISTVIAIAYLYVAKQHYLQINGNEH